MKKFLEILVKKNLKSLVIVPVILFFVIHWLLPRNFFTLLILFSLVELMLFLLAIDENKFQILEKESLFKVLFSNFIFVFYNLLVVVSLIFYDILFSNMFCFVAIDIITAMFAIKINNVVSKYV